MADYFNENLTYDSNNFRRRFQMDQTLFLRILDDLTNLYPYFVQKPDCTGKLGLSPHQKLTAAIQQLAYGMPLDATDKYCCLGKTTARQNLVIFCRAIQETYGPTYLRAPNKEDLKTILAENTKQGFPGCISSLDF
ncbi:hypothetical protein PCANC_18937 [Puccinia coronata f. sp. avenae]|uniref:Uncharacterized protein n=1 Tax=Puccinia coronata f. sp. avenae TaxID=200324 RepID=A0A2N5SJ45_9BASI|nr:hypothetical protein PCANC_18937 [Puccinia coronata f. sp. avenae]